MRRSSHFVRTLPSGGIRSEPETALPPKPPMSSDAMIPRDATPRDAASRVAPFMGTGVGAVAEAEGALSLRPALAKRPTSGSPGRVRSAGCPVIRSSFPRRPLDPDSRLRSTVIGWRVCIVPPPVCPFGDLDEDAAQVAALICEPVPGRFFTTLDDPVRQKFFQPFGQETVTDAGNGIGDLPEL